MFHSQNALRRVLAIDALASGATGLLLIVAAGPLEGLLGIPATLSRGAGLVLVPYVAFVTMLAVRGRFSASAVWLVIVANLLWAGASVLVLASGVVEPNFLGYAFVLAKALVVGVLGAAQYLALRQQPAVSG